jgi:cysteine-S-conjugate beta-lyase
MLATTKYDFDTVHNRRNTGSAKWGLRFGANKALEGGFGIAFEDLDEDVLPMWVADMDFPSPKVISDAMKARLEHSFFGYTIVPDELREVVVDRMRNLYGWDIQADWLLFNPGMVTTLNIVTQCVGKAGDGVLTDIPAYGPFLNAAPHRNRFLQMIEMRRIDNDNDTFRYEIDFDAFETAITKHTSLYYLCDPHNPTGRAFTRKELEKLADICLRHDIIIASDEIHCDLLMADSKHIPIASLSPEIANQTVTMISTSKTFNMPGQPCSISIVPNAEMREKMDMTSRYSGYHVDIMSYTAATAAYRDGAEWLDSLRDYLTANRDYTVTFIHEHLPMLKTTVPEATYLLWIDCTDLDVPEEYSSAQEFFVEVGRVALNPGTFFGPTGEPFVRLNFACPRSMLEDGLNRMKKAVDSLG